MSHLEEHLVFQLRAMRLPPPEREYRFAAEEVGREAGLKKRLRLAGLRDWRFDFAWPGRMFAVEVEGGGWKYGRHNRPKGFREDMDKYHHALRLGWTVYRCDGELIKTGQAARLIEQQLGG